jgi:hypothetical protein
MTETLQKIEVNRDENLKLLKQKKSLIIKQISAAKSKVEHGSQTVSMINLQVEIL